MSLEEGRRGELGGWEEKKVQEFKAETGRKYTRHLLVENGVSISLRPKEAHQAEKKRRQSMVPVHLVNATKELPLSSA